MAWIKGSGTATLPTLRPSARPSSERGMITRPGVEEILAYRHAVSSAMVDLLRRGDNRIAPLVERGVVAAAIEEALLVLRDGARESWIPGVDDADGREQEVRGVRERAVQRLREEAEPLAEPLFEHDGALGVGNRAPPVGKVVMREAARHAGAARDGRPAHGS